MTPTLLHAVINLTDVRTSDAELLARFFQSKDETAFEAIVRRHGPLVWSACRQLLPHHADAEDAFQAVFLTLIQSAGKYVMVKLCPRGCTALQSELQKSPGEWQCAAGNAKHER